MYRRLGGPEGRSWRAWKISRSPRFDPRTVQSVASRYTDWAIAAHIKAEQLTKVKSLWLLQQRNRNVSFQQRWRNVLVTVSLTLRWRCSIWITRLSINRFPWDKPIKRRHNKYNTTHFSSNLILSENWSIFCEVRGIPRVVPVVHLRHNLPTTLTQTANKQTNTGGYHLAQQEYGRILMPIRLSKLTNTKQNWLARTNVR